MTHPYATKAYADSLSHIGAALAVPEWGGFALRRSTPDGGRQDATGPYPLAAISVDADLAAGFDRLTAAEMVSMVFVLSERVRPPIDALRGHLDTMSLFKTHFIYDRALGALSYSKHHRYELRRVSARVDVSEFLLADHLKAWEALYRELATRHGMGGPHAFRPDHSAALAQLSGVRAFGAFVEGRLISAHLFVTHEGHAISHLAASSGEGYQMCAAYAVNDFAIAALADCDTINFGGGAGLIDDPADGLARFKKGFSNSTAPSYLCGKILDRPAYAALSAGDEGGGFFPAYRGRRGREICVAHQG